MNNETSRNQEQLMAMNAIYAFLTYLDMKEAVDVEAIVAGASDKTYAESPLFVKETTIAAIKNYATIVNAYNPKMNKWTFDRLNRVEQAILILAYCHFFYVDTKIDKPIVIDVAVRQAKGYLDDGDYKFVNAVLDKVLVRG
jgi:transcription termination factor NusB